MLGPTIHHLLQNLHFLADVMQLPMASLGAVVAALAGAIAVLLVVAARRSAR